MVEGAGITMLPVDPIAWAQARSIDVAGKPLRGCQGSLISSGNSFGILYSNSLPNRGLINFTVAHELGHFHLPGHPELLFAGGETVHQSQNNFTSATNHEREADHFAVGLLMPRFLVIPVLRKAGCGMEAAIALSKACSTSLTASAIRLAETCDDAVVIAVSVDGRIDWCASSKRVQHLDSIDLRVRRSLPPPGSITTEFWKDRDNVAKSKRDEGTTYLSDWFDNAPRLEMLEEVIGLGTYGRVLTILSSDADLDDIDSE